MAEQTPNLTPDSQEPFIPPRYLLILAGIAFLVAFVVSLTQPEFGVVGYGGLALGVLALLAWALMAPDQARGALTGRTARFGGLSVVVTVIFLAALVLIYTVVRDLDLRADLSERDTYSLTTQAEEAIRTLGSDPTLPPIKMTVLYGAAQAGLRDQTAVLFDDYVAVSGGKISYEFVDPDRNPQIASTYGATNGQIVVTTLNEDGTPDVEDAEVVPIVTQDGITNAILKASAGGDFRAYVMAVEDGIGLEPGEAGAMTLLTDELTNRYGWNVQEVGFLDLARSENPIQLNDPAADGEVMMIVGGTNPLGQQELDVITEYVNNGGDLVIFAESSLNEDGESLASGQALGDYLFNAFGLRVRNDVVIDPVDYIQSPLVIFTNDLNPNAVITDVGLPPGQAALVVQGGHSIEVSDAPPANVVVEVLASSSPNAFSRTGLEGLEQLDVTQTDADLQGPVVLAAAAENTQTGARVVLFGSTSPVLDDFAALQSQSIVNLAVGFNSLVWATRFDEFFVETSIVSDVSPQDAPIFADAPTLRSISFLTLIALPFGVLAIGVLVWWNNRERERASR